MSGCEGKADTILRLAEVRKWPNADIQRSP